MMRGSRQPPSGVTRKGMSHNGDAPHSCSGGDPNTSSDVKNFNRNTNWDNVLDKNSFAGVQRSHNEGGGGREGVMLNSRGHSLAVDALSTHAIGGTGTEFVGAI